MTNPSLSLNPSLRLDPLTDVRELVAFPFMVHALEAGAIVAIVSAVAGWFMVLRRESFAGHTLAVMSFPGASGAALVGLPLASGYLAACAAAALVIALGSHGGRPSRGQHSALVGTVQVSAFALGFVFLSQFHGVLEDLETLLFGSFLGITSAQVETLLAVAVAAIAFFVVAGRPLLYASLDDAVARARGVPVRALNVAFLLVLGLVVASAAQITGALLVFALLVAPAAAAQKFTARPLVGVCLAVAIGLAVTWLGLTLSYFSNDSVGFFITSLGLGCYAAASLARRVVPRAWWLRLA